MDNNLSNIEFARKVQRTPSETPLEKEAKSTKSLIIHPNPRIIKENYPGQYNNRKQLLTVFNMRQGGKINRLPNL